MDITTFILSVAAGVVANFIYKWLGGWFKDSKLTGRKLETIKMDANKTVYAKWKKEDTTNPKTGDTIGLAAGVLALTTVLGAAVVTKKKRTW